MKALSSIASHIYTIQYAPPDHLPKLLACGKTRPFQILAFKSRKHAQLIQKHLVYEGQEIVPLTRTSHVLTKDIPVHKQKKSNKELTIVHHGLVDLYIRTAVNNLQLILIDDISDNRNNIILYNQELNSIYIDPVMILSNLEKLL